MNILLVQKCYHLIKKIIEQAKFTYSPLGKAFEKQKQTETIEDQGEKQIKAIQSQGEIKTIKKYAHSDKDMFNKLLDKRLEEITKLDEKVNPDDLIYRYKGSTADEKFNEFDNAFSLLDEIRDGKVSLPDAKMISQNLNQI